MNNEELLIEECEMQEALEKGWDEIQQLRDYLPTITDNFIHSDFFITTDKPYYDIEMEVRQLLLSYYYTASVTVADYNHKTCVWYTASGRIT